eukprot:COSAG06_NODE_4505_length_4195_cov_72.292969_2_plen_104_part_00
MVLGDPLWECFGEGGRRQKGRIARNGAVTRGGFLPRFMTNQACTARVVPPFELSLIAFQNILASITYSLPCLSVHVTSFASWALRARARARGATCACDATLDP